MMNPIRKCIFLSLFGVLFSTVFACSNTSDPTAEEDVGLRPDSSLDMLSRCNKVTMRSNCKRDENCFFISGHILEVDENGITPNENVPFTGTCENTIVEHSECVYLEEAEGQIDFTANVFYRKNEKGLYEYLKIEPFVSMLPGTDWTPCEHVVENSPAPGCRICQFDKP